MMFLIYLAFKRFVIVQVVFIISKKDILGALEQSKLVWASSVYRSITNGQVYVARAGVDYLLPTGISVNAPAHSCLSQVETST